MNKEEIIEMLNALKNNWAIDFDKMGELCDYCISTVSQLQKANDKLNKEENITMFIDTDNMEARYGEQLYTEDLEKRLKKANDKLEKIHNLIKIKRANFALKRCNGVNIDYMEELFKYDEDITSIIDGDDKEC